jgi:hypothetical protein
VPTLIVEADPQPRSDARNLAEREVSGDRIGHDDVLKDGRRGRRESHWLELPFEDRGEALSRF